MPPKKPTPAIIMTNQYIMPGTSSGGYGNYLNYLNRSEATIPQKQEGQYIQYLSYMDNPEKQAELFTAGNDGLTTQEKQDLQQQFEQGEQNGSPLWQTVFSFDNDWLQQNGLYDPDTHLADDQALRQYTRGAVSRLLEKEGLSGTTVWAAAIHYNTDNIHIHVAGTEPIPTRQPKDYIHLQFPRSWLEQQGIMTPERYAHVRAGEIISAEKEPQYYKPILSDLKAAAAKDIGQPFFCQNLMKFDSLGNLTVSIRGLGRPIPSTARLVGAEAKRDGKFKQNSIDQAKSYFVREITRDQSGTQQITDMIRKNLLEPTKKHASQQFVFDNSLMVQYQTIYARLVRSQVKPGQWNYGMNKLADLRPALDALSQQYIQTYHAEEWISFEQALNKKAAEYQATYGDRNAGRTYKQNKIQDVYQRLGNAILGTMRVSYTEQQQKPELRTKEKYRKIGPGGSRFTDAGALAAFLTGLQRSAANYRKLARNLNTTWYKTQEQKYLEEEIAIEEGLNPNQNLDRI